MNKHKIYFSLILILCLLCDYCRLYAHEADNNFTTIMIGRYDSDEKNILVSQYRVIEEQSDFWFSEQDIIELTGYNITKRKNKIMFTRGSKIIQINTKNETLNVGNNISLINSPNIVISDNDILYFSGSQLLPWLNVKCYEEEGILYVIPDKISLWDFIDTFNQTKESFLFDFRYCCQQLEVRSKWLDAVSFICDNGIGMLKYIKIPFSSYSYGEYEKYYDIFEEMLEEQNNLWNIYKKTRDLASMSYDVISLMDEIEGNYVNEFDIHYTRENLFDYLNYFHLIIQNNDEKLRWINAVLGNRLNYSYPEAMISAALDIKDSYSNVFDGILIKGMHMFIDWQNDRIIDNYTGDGVFKWILDGVDIYQDYAIDWLANIDNIKYYNAIATAGIAVFNEYYDSKQTDIYAIELLRAHTSLYLYATEKNWEIMAEYAEHKGKTQLKKEYLEKASLVSDWLAKFIMSSDSTTNDSFRYGEGQIKEEYTANLKTLFSMLQTETEYKNKDILNNITAPKLNKFLSIFIREWFKDYYAEAPEYSELLSFAKVYLKRYNWEKFRYETGYEIVSKKDIDDVLRLYFNIVLPDENLDKILFHDGDFYYNGEFYFEVSDGALWGEVFAIVDEIQEIEKDEYVITFYEVYASLGDYDTGDINPMIPGWPNEHLYYDCNIEQVRKDKFCEIESKKECQLKWQDGRFIVLKYSTIYNFRNMDEIGVAKYVYNEIPELKKYEDYLYTNTNGKISLIVYCAGENNEVDTEGITHSCYMVYVGESHPEYDVNWDWFFVDKRTFQIFWFNIFDCEIYTLEEWRECPWHRQL